MANFTQPFAANDPDGRRAPTATEKENGYIDGPADRKLFNFQWHRIESELGAVLSEAGIEQSDADYTQLKQAIQAMIDSATGGGATENYVLFSQLTAAIPIYPEIKTSDNKINVTSPASNKVRVPSGIEIVHRGIKVYTTTEVTFDVDNSSTYHLRWHPVDGLSCNNLADTSYNADGSAEEDEKFDTTFDDVLLARAVINANGVATITNLRNASRLSLSEAVTATNWSEPQTNNAKADILLEYNWARKPDFHSMYRVHLAYDGASAKDKGNDNDEYLFVAGGTSQISKLPFTRYNLNCRIGIDFAHAAKYDISAMA